MVINKQITLGRKPEQAGIKDAVHVAIVSCRAGQYLTEGTPVDLNEYGEAVPSNKPIGIVDPFLSRRVEKGDFFWLVMYPKEVGSVQHTWEHGTDFSEPSRPVQENQYLAAHAKSLGVSYEFLMRATKSLVENNVSLKYEGLLDNESLKEALDKCYDFWYDWSNETGYEFYNQGTECCPEYGHPDISSLFDY